MQYCNRALQYIMEFREHKLRHLLELVRTQKYIPKKKKEFNFDRKYQIEYNTKICTNFLLRFTQYNN